MDDAEILHTCKVPAKVVTEEEIEPFYCPIAHNSCKEARCHLWDRYSHQCSVLSILRVLERIDSGLQTAGRG